MNREIIRLVGTYLLVLGLLAASLMVFPRPARADSWSDHFDGPNGKVFDPRWAVIGPDVGIQDGTTYFRAYDFDTDINTSWHGPTIRAAIPLSGDFDVSATLYCVAVLDITLGRADIRLLDSSGRQVLAFGWEDSTRTDHNAKIWLRGTSDAQVFFSTGLSDDYSNFVGMGIRLTREDGVAKFLFDGNEEFSGDVGRVNIAYVELTLLKYGGETECVPNDMMFDYISATYTPSAVPSAPTGLSCLPAASAANLNWTAPSDGGAPITGYKIHRGTAAGAESYLTTIGPATGYVDNGLTNGLTYYYKVSALNAVGESSLSSGVSVTPVALPGPPTGLQAVGGDSVANITWNPPASDGGLAVTAYRVYRSAGGDAALVAETSMTSYSDTTAANGVAYSYFVSAVNLLGEGPKCLSVLVVPGSSLTLPGVPRNLFLTGGNGNITLTWDPPETNGNTPILNYTVYRGDALASITAVRTLPVIATFLDTGLSNGVIYYYKISATNSVGEGPLTDVSACTPESVLPPGAPSGLAVNVTERQAVLTWQAPADDGGSPVTGYRLFRGPSPGNANLLVELGVAYSYTDTGLAWNTSYYYSVSALNAVGEGSLSGEVTVTTPAAEGDGNQTEVPPPSWTDNFSITSGIATMIALVVGLAIAYLFMRGDGGDARNASGKGPDKPVDDEPQDDGADEEEKDN